MSSSLSWVLDQSCSHKSDWWFITIVPSSVTLGDAISGFGFSVCAYIISISEFLLWWERKISLRWSASNGKTPFQSEGSEALAQVAHGSCGCFVPGSAQGQVKWGLGQPELVGGNQHMAVLLGCNDLSDPFQPRTFYDISWIYGNLEPQPGKRW